MTYGPMREVFQSSTHPLRLQGMSLPQNSHLSRRNSFHQALILLSILLILAPNAEAGPIHWLKNHPKTSKLITAGVAAGIHAAGLHSCRTRGVENCDGKYGASWGIFGAVTGANLLMIPVSEKIGGWQGNAISYGGSAAQFGHGVFEWQKGTNAKAESASFSSLLRKP